MKNKNSYAINVNLNNGGYATTYSTLLLSNFTQYQIWVNGYMNTFSISAGGTSNVIVSYSMLLSYSDFKVLNSFCYSSFIPLTTNIQFRISSNQNGITTNYYADSQSKFFFIFLCFVYYLNSMFSYILTYFFVWQAIISITNAHNL